MKKFLKFMGWTLGILAIVAIVLRLTILRLWTIPDDLPFDASLRPTLHSGDLVVILTVGKRGLGDLVRCPDPEDAQRYVVGRITGLEGDEVEMEGNNVRVNGKRYGEQDGCGFDKFTVPHPKSGADVPAVCNRVEMGGGWHYQAGVQGVTAGSDPTPHKVGPGRLFLLSDDRSFHDDSRDFGDVLADTCTDLVVFRLWGKSGFQDYEQRFSYIR